MIDNYLSRSYSGPPFVLFSLTHMLAVVAVIGACVILALVLARASVRQKEWLRHGIAWFAVLNLAVWYAWEWSVGLSAWSYSLPLQICTAAQVLCPLMLWTRSYRLFEVLYFWGMAGATQALLTPDLGAFGFPHFVFVTFFTSHGAIFAAVVFMLVAEGFRPHWHSIPRAVLVTLAFFVLAGMANWLTGGNYMYLAGKPVGGSLLDLLGPWPWYLALMIAIGILAFVLVYLPFAVRDATTARRHKTRLGET